MAMKFVMQVTSVRILFTDNYQSAPVIIICVKRNSSCSSFTASSVYLRWKLQWIVCLGVFFYMFEIKSNIWQRHVFPVSTRWMNIIKCWVLRIFKLIFKNKLRWRLTNYIRSLCDINALKLRSVSILLFFSFSLPVIISLENRM